MTTIGTRVLAIQKSTEVSAHVFGEGVYLGERIPDQSPFKELGVRNPYIKLDDGTSVWGFQCWWGDVERGKRALGNRTIFQVKNDNTIEPVEEE